MGCNDQSASEAFPLPYYRSTDELPEPLPTTAAIEAAEPLEAPDPVFKQRAIRVGSFIVKYGPYVNQNEVPSRVCLLEAWPTLSDTAKTSGAAQLRVMLDEMRVLPPPDFYGGVDGGPLEHPWFFDPQHDPAVTGPFRSTAEIANALALRSQKMWTACEQRGWTSEFYARNLPAALVDQRITFTHADFHSRNILVQKLDGNDAYHVTGIVDWESAGWYPSYWEYTIAFATFQWHDDWPEKIDTILDPRPLHATLLRMVHGEILL